MSHLDRGRDVSTKVGVLLLYELTEVPRCWVYLQAKNV